MPAVRPEYGPSLPEIARPRLARLSRTARRLLSGLAGFIVVMAVAYAIHGSGSGLTDVLVREPVAFTLGHRSGLVKAAPQGDEVLRLETKPGASPQSFTARPLHFPVYSGDVSAAMLSVASSRMAQLRKDDPTFSYRGEGKARINLAPAYQLAFQTRRSGRLQFGRIYFLAPPSDADPHPRDGIELMLLSQYSAKSMPNIGAVGATGVLKVPLRSFRFGTERP